MIDLIRDLTGARRRLAELRAGGRSIGLVPTMGALHDGHLSLVHRARNENNVVVVWIFVNPTQYDDPADLERYPRTLEADLEKVEATGADLVIHPEPGEVYHDDYRFKVVETAFSRELEGAHRDGHFDGVLTVVLKLLNIAGAHRAYFGEKDWQQLELVRGMAAAFFHPTKIVACPTVREPDGLAMSSRNVHLSPEERAVAPELHRILSGGGSPGEMTAALEHAGFDVDYVERRDDRVLGAVRLGKVRLIDNVEV
ncbi:MAG: pantoate--beta-alanine ligase [Thermoanaerobaculales bacterium]|jgi:pantoate--beta-alanine ligase|nr:pantoate--beta-alanine ligase [Thermoanaerobaculales bacterium]